MKKLNWMKPHLLVQQLACAGLLAGFGQVHAATPVYANVGTYDKTECVQDAANNLMWEGKTASGDRAGSNMFTNYDDPTQPQRYDFLMVHGFRNPTAAEINASDNSIGYVNAVNALNLCGFNDWRMPTKDELLTLVKAGSSPMIDTVWFPNTPAFYVWSGSPKPTPESVDVVSFSNGQLYSTDRINDFGVRLVRSGQSSAPLTAQTIAFGTPPTGLVAGGGTGTVSATGGVSGNAVTFTSTTPSVCTVSGTTVTPVAAGTCTIAANQAGNATYSAATQVTQDITVGAAASKYEKVGTYAITECVKDTTTNLIWEGKTASGTRAGSMQYSNFDSTTQLQADDFDLSIIRSPTTAEVNAAANSIGYVNAVNALNLCGFNDWRMPTKDELLTLVKAGSSPMIDTVWFPNSLAFGIWSSSPDANAATRVWGVAFNTGISISEDRGSGYGVRLVRAPLTAQTIAFGTPPTGLVAGGTTGTVSATGGASGNAVTFTSLTTSICTVNSSTGVVTPVAVGTCTIAANQAGSSGYSAATQVTQNITIGATPPPPAPPPPAPTPPTPTPPTPTALNNGVISNTATGGGELLNVCSNILYAGSDGATVRATGVNNVIDVAVQNGSINIPCPVANPFCKTTQNQITALQDETVRFGANCTVNTIQITPANPQTIPKRLYNQSLIDSMIAVIRAKVPALGAETTRQVTDWSALGLGFSLGHLSVKAQSPMQVNPTLPDSTSLLPNGTVQVVTQGIIVNLVPALVNADRFNTELKKVDNTIETRTNADGSIVILRNHAIYSVRPNLFLTNTDSSLFTVNENQEIRFDNQRIHPAIYNFEQFKSMLTALDSSATVQVQLDGKLQVMIKGQTYTLIPDYEVIPTTGLFSSNFTVQDGKMVVNYPFGFSQRFSVQQ